MTEKTVQRGGRILLNFALRLKTGEEVDSNFGSDPIELQLGNGDMPESFEAVLVGAVAGQTVEQTIACDDAFGRSNEDNRQRFKRSAFADDMELTPGLVVSFADANGSELPGVVIESLDEAQSSAQEYVWVDFNHPLADKDIVFKATIHEVLA